MRCKAVPNAFTLIEMLVSLAIVATIVTMVYGSYAATSRTLDAYTGRMACSEQAHLVLRMMTRQIRCAYMPPAANGSTNAQTEHKISFDEPAVAFEGQSRGLQGNILSFTTTAGFGVGLDNPVGFSRIIYRYDQVAGSLSMCCQPGACNSSSLRETDAWRPVLSGVSNIELQFYDGKHWQVQWNSKQTGRLPQVVKIAMTVTDQNGREHSYATAMSIACGDESKEQQTRTSGERS
ncbi:MAG: type II secretion system protein GspJ [Solirubrobacterales bacterium]